MSALCAVLVLAILACLCWARVRHRRSADMPIHITPKPFHIFHHDSSYRHSSRASGTTLPDAYLSAAGAQRTPTKYDHAFSASRSGNGSGSSGGGPRGEVRIAGGGHARMDMTPLPGLLPSGSTAPPTGSPIGPAAAAEGTRGGSRAMHGGSSGLQVPLLETSASSVMTSGSVLLGTGVRTMKDAVGQAIREMEGAIADGGDGAAEAQLRVHALIGRGGFGTVYRGAPHPPFPLRVVAPAETAMFPLHV